MSESRPNIVMIMTDQQRADALGCVNPRAITPGIDSLAANGILFDQAVCQCPMCVPSRNSLMFGMYASQTGVRTNGGALLDETRLPSVPLPQLLHDSGYFCAGFGKTHWNNCIKGEEGSRRGFDVRAEGQPRFSVLCEEGAVMMDDEDPEGLKAYFEETKAFGSGEENIAGYIGLRSTLPKEHHRDGFIHKKCAEFIESYTPGEKPLFLYFSLIKPHAGFNIPPEFEDMYDISDFPEPPAPPWTEEPDTHDRALRNASAALGRNCGVRAAAWRTLDAETRARTRLRYLANCTFMDWFINDILTRLRRKGLDKNTLFIFCSDHGDMMGERIDRFSKYCLFESSVRVPLILAGDVIAKAARGSRDHRPAMLTDIYPTICAAAGIKCDPRLPGESLLAPATRRGAFCEFHGGGPEKPHPAPSLMWRENKYKLILFRDGSVLDDTPLKGEMYDLEADPREWNNLYYSPEYMHERLRLTEALLSHLATAYAKGPAYADYGGYAGIERA
ncbi:MAG: sulfatase-like hydrolase/transferase [Clostridia bacterium]|nr:sulfatase-like hydrolase/transferase [Clostridia bacterium]